MSSSNQVRIAMIEETTYGETPVVGDFETVRFTSDSLSGSPETTESQQIRTDRASSGQVVTSLTVGGDLNYELAKEPAIDLLLESAMYNSWASSVAVSADLDIDATAKTLTRAGGDFNTDVKVGDIITLAGFVATNNNTQVMVGVITSATVIGIITPDTITTESATGGTFQVADTMGIGTVKKSLSLEKSFLDLSEKAINYRGMIISNFAVSAAYGSIVTGNFTASGNNYEPVEVAADFITDGRTITPAATTNSMNGSVDMPFIANNADGSFNKTDFCIQSVDISLNNNLTPQTCIGEVAPKDYSEGTAQIEVSISAYLADANWEFLAKKLSQQSFSIGFMVKNGGGYYGFYLPAVQVSFDDPASAGINQDVIMDMSGVAKIGLSGETPLTIYRG